MAPNANLSQTRLNLPQCLGLGDHLEHALPVARGHAREGDHLEVEVLLQPQLVHHPDHLDGQLVLPQVVPHLEDHPQPRGGQIRDLLLVLLLTLSSTGFRSVGQLLDGGEGDFEGDGVGGKVRATPEIKVALQNSLRALANFKVRAVGVQGNYTNCDLR